MKALIITNAYATHNISQANRIKSELCSLNVQTDIKTVDKLNLIADGNTTKPDYDFCVFLDKDKYAARLLENSGLRLFNNATAIETCDDKMLTHITLNGKVDMPTTIPGLLCHSPNATPSKSFLDEVEKILDYPLIFKLSYGSLGNGVFKINDRKELDAITAKHVTEPHLFQKYVQNSHGKDMRVIVIGGKVVGGIIRQSDNGDFRSNIGQGGKAFNTDVPHQIQQMAITAANAIGLDYCGIDFLIDDTPLLCEVNSNAFFDAFERTTNINVAKLYAEHMLQLTITD